MSGLATDEHGVGRATRCHATRKGRCQEEDQDVQLAWVEPGRVVTVSWDRDYAQVPSIDGTCHGRVSVVVGRRLPRAVRHTKISIVGYIDTLAHDWWSRLNDRFQASAPTRHETLEPSRAGDTSGT
jgi:hypothetical protein